MWCVHHWVSLPSAFWLRTRELPPECLHGLVLVRNALRPGGPQRSQQPATRRRTKSNADIKSVAINSTLEPSASFPLWVRTTRAEVSPCTADARALGLTHAVNVQGEKGAVTWHATDFSTLDSNSYTTSYLCFYFNSFHKTFFYSFPTWCWANNVALCLYFIHSIFFSKFYCMLISYNWTVCCNVLYLTHAPLFSLVFPCLLLSSLLFWIGCYHRNIVLFSPLISHVFTGQKRKWQNTRFYHLHSGFLL